MSINLILITPPLTSTRELTILPKLLDLSPSIAIHIRKPNANTPEQLGDYLDQIPAQFHRRLVVHSHHQLARKYKLRGIHYRESDIPDGTISAVPGLTTSCSFHQPSQLGVCRGDVDYCFLSPIYDSISKQDYKSAFEKSSHNELREYVLTSRYPVYALGGVTPDKFDELADLGFSGAVLLGYIWEAEDPIQALNHALQVSQDVAWNDTSISCSTTT